MVRLIKFEMKKHFMKRAVFIIILLFSIVNAVKIYSVYEENSYISKSSNPVWNEVYWQLYSEYGGTITTENIEKLLSVYRPLERQIADNTASRRMDNPDTYTGNVYSDYFLLRDYFVRPMEYAYMYKNAANGILNTARDNIGFYGEIGNSYKYRENAIIAELFSGRYIENFAYTEMYQYYLEYSFSSLLVLLICLYGLVGVFVSEKESDMDTVLLTTVSGGGKTIAAKIIASMLFIFAVCFWFWLMDFITFSISFSSLEAASSPLYALKNFEYTAVNLTLIQYSILAAFIKTFGMMIIGISFLCISSASKNALLPFALNLALVGGIVVGQELVAGSDFILGKIVNPFILVATGELFKKVEFINFFGVPILSYVAALLIAVLVGIALMLLLLLTAKRNSVTRRARL